MTALKTFLHFPEVIINLRLINVEMNSVSNVHVYIKNVAVVQRNP